MKRIITMLFIACSAITTVSADSATPQKKAKSVIQSLEGVIAFHAKEGGQTLSVIKNPETGLIESSERIAPFTCKKDELWDIPIGFEHDEPLSYQYMHLLPGNKELFNLEVVNNDGQTSKNVPIRTNSRQEMWFLCCKNPDNPQLRDAYAIVWEETKEKKVAGTVFMITSLRPDYYAQSKRSRTGSKLFGMPQDDDVVAVDTVAVEDVEDVVIMADGTIVSADSCLVDTIPGYNETGDVTAYGVPVIPQPSMNGANDWRSAITPQQQMELERKAMSMKWSIENVKAPYESVAKDVELIDFFNNTSYFDETYKSIIKRNKELDKNFHELVKALEQLNMPDKELKEGLGQGYKEMLKIFTDQSKYFNEIYKKTGKLSSAAQKTQKYINKLTEKYISEMGKLIYQMP
jgi:hypothetical protein